MATSIRGVHPFDCGSGAHRSRRRAGKAESHLRPSALYYEEPSTMVCGYSRSRTIGEVLGEANDGRRCLHDDRNILLYPLRALSIVSSNEEGSIRP